MPRYTGPMSAHDYEFEAIDADTSAANSIKLSDYSGRALLVVNTASECAYTPQYAGLQQLADRFTQRGLVVLGVPSNDFGDQEPGSEGEIQQFCTTNYAVSFTLTKKQHVTGPNAHPFYQWLVDTLGEIAAPKWNFHKYLIGPDGQLAGLWESSTDPLDEELIETVEQLLSEVS